MRPGKAGPKGVRGCDSLMKFGLSSSGPASNTEASMRRFAVAPIRGLGAVLSGAAGHEPVASEVSVAGGAGGDLDAERVRGVAVALLDAEGGAAEPAADVAAVASRAVVTALASGERAVDAGAADSGVPPALASCASPPTDVGRVAACHGPR